MHGCAAIEAAARTEPEARAGWMKKGAERWTGAEWMGRVRWVGHKRTQGMDGPL